MAHQFLAGLRALTKSVDELGAEEVRPLLHKYFEARTHVIARSLRDHCDAIVRMCSSLTGGKEGKEGNFIASSFRPIVPTSQPMHLEETLHPETVAPSPTVETIDKTKSEFGDLGQLGLAIDVEADFRDASGISLDGGLDQMQRGRRMMLQPQCEEKKITETVDLSMKQFKRRKMVHFEGTMEGEEMEEMEEMMNGVIDLPHEGIDMGDGERDEDEDDVLFTNESRSLPFSEVEGPRSAHIVHSQLDTKEFYRYIGTAKRFRDIEKRFVSATVLKRGLPYVIRCDGRAFSKFCSGMARPHDVRFYRVMKLTAQDAIEKFNANSVYLESDEMSLFFFPDEDGSAFFRGRVQKIVSVVASYIAARFNFHIMKENFSDLDLPVQTRMHAGEAHFDARVFNLSSDDAMMDCCLWRMCDGVRNSINNLGRQFLTQDEMNKKPITDVLLSLVEKGILWEEEPAWYKYGALIKLNKNKKKASHVIWNCFLRRSAETKQLLKDRFAPGAC